jgi:hypothetical protein
MDPSFPLSAPPCTLGCSQSTRPSSNVYGVSIQFHILRDRTMAHLLMSAQTAMPFSGMVRGLARSRATRPTHSSTTSAVEGCRTSTPASPRASSFAGQFDGGPVSNKFMRAIRQYNCLFAFTSMGANIDRSINDGRGPPVFKICGQIHHCIGSLLPPDDNPPKFI